MGEMGGFDAVAVQAHPEIEAVNHVHHAGNSSGIVDGAAAVLIGSRAAGRAAKLKPRARIRAFANVGSEPALMLTGPVDVTRKVLKRARMQLADLDLIEVNEAFAAVVLRYLQAFDLDPAKVNVNGGAIAMGHPLGATGAMILGIALDELERTESRHRAGDLVHRRRHGHRDHHRESVIASRLRARSGQSSGEQWNAEDRHRERESRGVHADIRSPIARPWPVACASGWATWPASISSASI